ncbi:MAG: hypothetical protein QOI98_301, partial [Solirubrobacteraceae bacterium]|nr:hypothetical protein [Solirubrobacteraceae bacterium]
MRIGPITLPGIDDVVNAGANAWDMYLGEGVAQMHPTSRA